MNAAPAPAVQIHRSMRRSVRAFDEDRFRWLDAATAAGPLTKLRFGPLTTWVVTDPDLARTMLIQNAADWVRPSSAVVPIRLGIGENLFTQSDESWALLQPAVAPAFRRRALDGRLLSMHDVIADSVARIPVGTPFDVELAMGVLALRVAAWVLLGEEMGHDRAVELADHQRNVVTWVAKRLSGLTSTVPFAFGAAARAMRAHRHALDGYADEVIGRARTSRDRVADDTLGCLLAARPGGKALTDTELRSHLLGLLFAGNETTAAALSWAFVHGAGQPAEWARLRVDDSAVRPFVDENLRLTPAVWAFARNAAKRHTTLGGQRIGRTGVVTVYLRGMNLDANRWDDPHEFRPSRHVERGNDPGLLPFGLGPRGCIGQHMAMAEMIAALPLLARRGDVGITQAVEPDPSFALRVRGGLQATLRAV